MARLTSRLACETLVVAVGAILCSAAGCGRHAPPAPGGGASPGSSTATAPTPSGLDGLWMATGATVEGKVAGRELPIEIVGAMQGLEIAGQKIVCKFQGIEVAHGTIQQDSAQQPATVDIQLLMVRGRVGGESIAGQTVQMRGIYEWSGDTLKLCYFMPDSNAAKAGQRPTVFQSRPGSGEVLITYRRQL
jgi:uncharacterized protein (TIGR03067 family)